MGPAVPDPAMAVGHGVLEGSIRSCGGLAPRPEAGVKLLLLQFCHLLLTPRKGAEGLGKAGLGLRHLCGFTQAVPPTENPLPLPRPYLLLSLETWAKRHLLHAL